MVEIIINEREFETKVLNAMAKALNKAMRKAIPEIKKEIILLTAETFTKTPETESLVRGGIGSLRGHFGLPQGQEIPRVSKILADAVNQIIIKLDRIKRSGNQLTGGLTISVLKSDFSELIGLREGHVITDKGRDLPWVEWLLTRGTEIIITEFHIEHGPFGRSGLAIMTFGSNWSVPSWASGTNTDNWLTRPLLNLTSGYLSELNKIVEKEIKKALS